MKMNLDCQACTGNLKKARGCTEEAPVPMFDLDGKEYCRCPLKIITRQSMEYIRFYSFFRDGYLPNAGGIMDQPAKFLDAMSMIESVLAETQEEMRKKWRK